MKGLDSDFVRDLDKWKKITEVDNPAEETFPGRWFDAINDYQRLIIIRALTPNKFTKGVQSLIIKHMDKLYITPPPFDLELTYKDSDERTPLIFILSPGADPRS